MNEKNDVASIDSTVLLEELSAQIEVWETKARTLDKMGAKLTEHDHGKTRIQTKAGCFRGCATDLKLLLREFTSNVPRDSCGN